MENLFPSYVLVFETSLSYMGLTKVKYFRQLFSIPFNKSYNFIRCKIVTYNKIDYNNYTTVTNKL